MKNKLRNKPETKEVTCHCGCNIKFMKKIYANMIIPPYFMNKDHLANYRATNTTRKLIQSKLKGVDLK